MSTSATRVLFAATAFLLGSTALYAADMPVKAVPLPLQFSWAGAYVGVNAGGVLDRNDPGQLRLTSPGFVFVDPNGAFAGFPSPFFGFPGGFQSVPYAQSRSGGSFIGGGQIGYNLQSGNIVYGVEADFQVMRNRDTLSGSLLEFTPGVAPGGAGDITRNTLATYFIDRQWQATFRGRFGYAFDRLLVYATGGLAVTSLKTGGNYVFQTTIGPALAPFPGAPPQNFAAPGVGSSHDYLGVTFGGGLEYAFSNNWSLGAEYRFADFGKQNVTLAMAPAAGVLLPAVPVEMPVRLFSQQVTARLNYRFGGGEMATRSVALPGAPGSNWTGCYAGGYAGAAWSRGPVDTFDPSTNGQQVFGPPPLLQTTFYDSSAGESARPAPYSYNLPASGMGGGTLGCNWQPASSRFVWGVEAEAGVMRLSATVNNQYNLAFGFSDTFDTTTVGNWYAAFAGRLGYAVNDVLFYLKGGVGFTQVSVESIDLCTTTGGLCSSQALIARGNTNAAFFVVGGGAEWAFVQNWTVKAEYLYLGLDTSVSACGPGGGRLFLPNLTFCAKHEIGGIHTAKIGVNYKFF
jgi:outer membrane immunogenic protein